MSAASNVLIVDDRAANRYALAHTLMRSGFTVLEAATGREALDLARQQPAAILLDVKLPDILGYEVCRRIKANPQTSHIPVLQMSAAFMNDESKVYALESGADAYLTHPIEPTVLIATVKSLVRLAKAEAQTRLSARQWQATFDALMEGVALIDSEGVIQRCNRAMGTMIGRPYSQIERQPLAVLLKHHFHIELPAQIPLRRDEVKYGGRYFRFSIDPIFVNDLNPGSIFIIAEITGQKQAEAALLATERLAATGRVANTIAHEINNPLEAITNLLYLTRGTLGSVEVAGQYLHSAEEELLRVSRIARQILSFNRESKQPVEVNVAQMLDDVLALNNRAVHERALIVQKEYDGEITVFGFPAQLRQVFSNVIRNAIEASQPGTQLRVRITGHAHWRGEALPCARITICDQGTGIPHEIRKRIFEAFFTTKELRGSGIGLWLSSAIIDEHHGGIRVRSSTAAEHSGTCVTVTLPCAWRAADSA